MCVLTRHSNKNINMIQMFLSIVLIFFRPCICWMKRKQFKRSKTWCRLDKGKPNEKQGTRARITHKDSTDLHNYLDHQTLLRLLFLAATNGSFLVVCFDARRETRRIGLTKDGIACVTWKQINTNLLCRELRLRLW